MYKADDRFSTAAPFVTLRTANITGQVFKTCAYNRDDTCTCGHINMLILLRMCSFDLGGPTNPVVWCTCMI